MGVGGKQLSDNWIFPLFFPDWWCLDVNTQGDLGKHMLRLAEPELAGHWMVRTQPLHHIVA